MAVVIHQISTWLDVWTATRVTGLVAFGMLSVSMMFGILQSYPGITSKSKAKFYNIHQFMSWYGLLISCLHAFVLIFDSFVGYSWVELLIPFTSSDKPVLTGLGTIALYISVLLVITSDLRHKMKKKTWKAIHYLSFLFFIVAFIHGIFQGTDSGSVFIQMLYWGTGAIIILLISNRQATPQEVAKQRANT